MTVDQQSESTDISSPRLGNIKRQQMAQQQPAPGNADMHNIQIDESQATLDDCLLDFAAKQWNPVYRTNNDLCGWLNKRGKGSYYKRWQSRYLVLKDTFLFYFKRPTDVNPAGILFLDSNSEVHDVSHEAACEFSFSLTVDSSCSMDSRKSYQKRIYIFSASSEKSYHDWMTKLSKICRNSEDRATTPTLSRSTSTFIKRSSDPDAQVGRYNFPDFNHQGLLSRLNTGPRLSTGTAISGSSYESMSSIPFSTPRTSTYNTDSSIKEVQRLRSTTAPAVQESSEGAYSIAFDNPITGDDTSLLQRTQSQNLYSVFLGCKSKILEFSNQLKDALINDDLNEQSENNYLNSATNVVRQVRQLLYFLDGRFTKQIRNPDSAACISRNLSSVIDKLRQIGFHAKNLSEGKSSPEMIRELIKHLDELLKDLYSLINVSRSISDINLICESMPVLFASVSQPLIERCSELLSQAADLAYALNTQNDDLALRYVSVLSSFIKSVYEIGILIFPPIQQHIDFEFNSQSQQNRLIMDAREFEESLKRLKLTFETLEKLRDIVNKDSRNNILLTISENYFCSASYLARYIVTLGALDKHLRTSGHSELIRSFGLLVASLEHLTLTLPPVFDDMDVGVPIPKIDLPSPLNQSFSANARNSLRSPSIHSNGSSGNRFLFQSMKNQLNIEDSGAFDPLSPAFSPSINQSENVTSFRLDSEKPDQSTINEVVYRSVSELSKIAIDSARSLRMLLTSCTQTVDSESSEAVSQFCITLSSAASQIEEEMSAIECKGIAEESVVNLEHEISSMIDAKESFMNAQKNWMLMVSPSFSKSKMIDASVIFENQCNRLVIALETIVFAPHAREMELEKIPTPPQSLVVSNHLDAIVEAEEENDEHLQSIALEEVERIIENEDHDFENGSNIIFRMEGKQEIKGGTLKALVEKLTSHKLPSSSYTSAFLLTYRSFTSATEFLDLLIKRYNIEPPSDLEERQKSIYFSRKIIPIRLRVFNVIKMWVKNNYSDFENDEMLLKTLFEFIPTMRVDFHKGTTEFQALLERKKGSADTRTTPLLMRQPPPPIVPKGYNKASLELNVLDMTEIARQLTLMQWQMFYGILPKELFNQSWNRPELHHRSPHVRKMIQFSNFVIEWVSAEIVKPETPKQRAQVIKLFLILADKLRSLNNFDGLKCIICGLQASGIRRLYKTWELLSSKHIQLYDELVALMSEEKSYKNYRQVLHTIAPPCIPFIGVYLTDLTMIESGNLDFLKDYPDLINFHKRHLIAQVVQELRQYQTTPYCLEPVEMISEWIKSRETMSSEQVYDLSLLREPRAPIVQSTAVSDDDDENRPQERRNSTNISKKTSMLISLANFRNSNS